MRRHAPMTVLLNWMELLKGPSQGGVRVSDRDPECYPCAQSGQLR